LRAVAELRAGRDDYCIVLRADQRLHARDVYEIGYALQQGRGATVEFFHELAAED
jgi:hypothetical protein